MRARRKTSSQIETDTRGRPSRAKSANQDRYMQSLARSLIQLRRPVVRSLQLQVVASRFRLGLVLPWTTRVCSRRAISIPH